MLVIWRAEGMLSWSAIAWTRSMTCCVRGTGGGYSSVGKRSSLTVSRLLVRIQQVVPLSSALSKRERCQGWVPSMSLEKFLSEFYLDISFKKVWEEQKNIMMCNNSTSSQVQQFVTTLLGTEVSWINAIKGMWLLCFGRIVRCQFWKSFCNLCVI